MLHSYDSKSTHVRPLTSVTPEKVGTYLCGIIVQGSLHIGHLHAIISFDTLIRWLRRNGYEVTYVRNVIDIGDKTPRKSAEAGWDWWAQVYRFECKSTQAHRTFSVQAPTYEPRITGHTPEQLDLVQSLIDTGHAYSGGHGNVCFDVHSQTDYGSLIRQCLVDMRIIEDDAQIDEAVEVDRRDLRDFAPWKAIRPGESITASWDSPWGYGRPGWHLECSAMSRCYLGDEFDIHGSNIDLHFPHHENEQVQSYGTGWEFARLWVHNAWVTTKSERMSKSLDNILSIGVLTGEYPTAAVHWALSTVYYRSSIEWGAGALSAAHTAWEKFSTLIARAIKTAGEAPTPEVALTPTDLSEAFVAAMDDDLNVAGALAALHEYLKAGNATLAAGDVSGVYREQILVCSMLNVLGLDPASKQWCGQAGINVGTSGAVTAEHSALDALVQAALKGRAAAHAAKGWARADELCDRLAAAGITVTDGCDGATWSVG